MLDHIKHRLEFAKVLAKESGELAHSIKNTSGLKDDFLQEKAPQDFVTIADKAIDDLWRLKIVQTYPTDSILTEEQDVDDYTHAKGIWVLDPIDGTSNFVSSSPLWGVSVAYIYEGEVVIGLLYYPELDMCMWAVKGQGAFMNNQRIHVSKESIAERAKVILSRSSRWDLEEYIETIRQIDRANMVYRFYGCASYSLACIALGQSEIYYEKSVNIWDVLAGVLLVEEAGGKVKIFGTLSDFLYKPMDIIGHNNVGLDAVLLSS